ncbi:hypothetical protein [Candidatus Deianiraea vastatrix]|uniref:Uncharacterized protein n=1 Tax=Candidatus Deianiraea vastatrix TaxID=2163644 RepID=A0A5B8XDE5_9RICK|nr:hypothetical protein [Candidatus Deianiraea vastatrix]QED23036.1 hypothetical protein Deia_00228 [Candidatus Deianiraea vastatrix]
MTGTKITVEDLAKFGFTRVINMSDIILLDDVQTGKIIENRNYDMWDEQSIQEEEEPVIEEKIDPEEQKRQDEIKRKQEEQRKLKEAVGFLQTTNEQKIANDFLAACLDSHSKFNVAIISSKSKHHIFLKDQSLYINRIFTEFEDFDIKMMIVSDLNIPCPFEDEREAFRDSAVVLLYEKNACTKCNPDKGSESVDLKRKLLDLVTSIGLQFVFKNAYENGFYFYKRLTSNLSVNSYTVDDVSDFQIPESQILNVSIDGRIYKANTSSEFLNEML